MECCLQCHKKIWKFLKPVADFVTGNCILQYWNYAAISRPCKCPMCVRHITKLSPEPSLQERQEQEVKEVLDKVRRYNRLFVGGLTGFVQVRSFWFMILFCFSLLFHAFLIYVYTYFSFLWLGKTTIFRIIQKVHELPFLVKRMVWHMMDTDVNNLYFHEVRIFAVKNILPWNLHFIV